MRKLLKNNHSIGFVLAASGTLLFSLKSIFIKYLYLEGLDASTVLVMRMLISLPFYMAILFFILYLKKDLRLLVTPKVLLQLLMLGFLGYYLASILDLLGLELISAQLERLSLFTYPIMIAVLGFLFFKQRLTARLIFSLILAYLGLWLVMVQEVKIEGDHVVTGVILVLCSALSYSIYILLAKAYILRLGAPIFTCLAMIASTIFGIVHAMVFIEYFQISISLIAWFWLVALAVFSTVLPSFMITEAVKCIGPAHTSLVGMLGPIFTIVLAVVLLNEAFTPIIAVGISLVLLGVYSASATKSTS